MTFKHKKFYLQFVSKMYKILYNGNRKSIVRAGLKYRDTVYMRNMRPTIIRRSQNIDYISEYVNNITSIINKIAPNKEYK